MLAGSAFAAASGGLRLALLAFAAVKLVGHTLWIQQNQGAIVVILDSLIALALLASLHAYERVRHRSAASRWILVGAGVSVAGAAVQVFAVSHVLQAVAMALYYRGVATMQDRRNA